MKTENNQPKHTPGPWSVDGYNLTAVIAEQGVPGIHVTYKHICDCNYGYADPLKHVELNKANAQLIASAPEMLEALKKCVKAMENSNCDSLTTDQAKAIIKKATGQ